jgi:hypothetical protein
MDTKMDPEMCPKSIPKWIPESIPKLDLNGPPIWSQNGRREKRRGKPREKKVKKIWPGLRILKVNIFSLFFHAVFHGDHFGTNLGVNCGEVLVSIWDPFWGRF